MTITEETVNKTHPIARMQQEGEALPLSALKLIDIYLSRIDPNDHEHREVKFTLKEYCDLLEIDRDPTAARHRTFRMLTRQNAFSIPEKDKWKIITLFESCEYDAGIVTMMCTGTAADYLFNWAKYGYIRYKLKYILRLRSRHAYNLYIYLLDHKFRKTWTIDAEELRRKVYRIDVPYYDAFKYFKRDILDKSIEEVNEKTDINVSYTTQKDGRRVSAITFTVTTKDPSEPVLNLPEPTEPDEEPVQLSFDDPDDDPVMCFSDAVDDEFTRTELEAIRFRLCDIIQDPNNFKDRWDFLKKTWQKVKIIAEKRPIADTHAYLLAILDQEVDNRRI